MEYLIYVYILTVWLAVLIPLYKYYKSWSYVKVLKYYTETEMTTSESMGYNARQIHFEYKPVRKTKTERQNKSTYLKTQFNDYLTFFFVATIINIIIFFNTKNYLTFIFEWILVIGLFIYLLVGKLNWEKLF